MTRIGGTGGTRQDGLSTGQADTQPLLHRGKDDPAFGKADHRGEGFGLQGRFGNSGFHDGVPDEREHAFREKMARAIGDRDAAGSASDGAREPRLLAIAMASAFVPLPLPALAAEQVSVTIPAVPGGEAAMRVNALGDRIERAILAEIRGNPTATVKLNLDLPGGEAGLAGITISMNRDSVDIVLRHGAISDLAGMTQAVQSLAERLQTRFAHRTVKILALETSAAREVSRSMDEISALFARPGDRS
ncbi:MAG: hypothetical protein ACT6U0_04790 [Shinella sp.]|uniref:hypothetical protein n=1 Tax=Shinella sp. TaxID=1870904 RepID=UPI004036ACDF